MEDGWVMETRFITREKDLQHRNKQLRIEPAGLEYTGRQ